MSHPTDSSLQDHARFWCRWLFEDALPLWAKRGVNFQGGFFERLTSSGEPTHDAMRLRVQARQVYVYSEAGRMGWKGEWRGVVRHGLEFLLERATRADGLVCHRFDLGGKPLEGAPDLYDQSFALFAYAAAYDTLRDDRARTAAHRLLEALERYREPAGGYRELDGGAGLLRANPQMHMLEAALAWVEIDEDPKWRKTAHFLHGLCADRIVEPSSGALREFFGSEWRPAAPPLGLRTEPGHHFEWGWLILKESAGGLALATRLCERAERVGVDSRRGVVVNAVDVDGQVIDPKARLWPQTERLKAALALRDTDPVWTERARQAAETMKAYLHPTRAGLWRDVMEADGVIRPESAPASSMYHLVCAISELVKAVDADA